MGSHLHRFLRAEYIPPFPHCKHPFTHDLAALRVRLTELSV